MNIENIIKKALDGDAILFLGAGFSKGAKNIAGKDYFIGKELCVELIKKGNIDIEGEDKSDLSDLGYISQRYLETGNTKRDLINLLKENYRCSEVAEEHEIIAAINWKKIYTTNYDDVMEVASRKKGILREPVVASTQIKEVYNTKKSVIHINGYVGTVDEKNLATTFKLTEESYRNSSIKDSEWSVAIRTDIRNAKSVIFIGYSMGYDLELQQIFSADEELRKKCMFVTYMPGKRALATMKSFGHIFDGGVLEFSKLIKQIDQEYDRNDKMYEFNCLKKVEIGVSNATTITSESIIRLFVDGYVEDEKVHLNLDNNYVIRRKCIDDIVEFFSREGKLVILHSDLANGKTIAMKQLEKRLDQIGTVYYLDKLEMTLADDLEYISTLMGTHFIFFENYNQLLDNEVWTIIKKYEFSNIKYVLTARSYINDNFYSRVANDLSLNYKTMGMYDLNILSETEIIDFIRYIDNYNLWRRHSSYNMTYKKKFIQRDCKNEISNILIEIYKSENVSKKVNEIVDLLCKNDTCREILLIAFIGNAMAINITYDDIETVLGYRINKLYFEQFKEIRELLSLDGMYIRFKSSSVAKHIISNYSFNADILRLLKEMVNVLSRHTYNSRYVTILKLIISFSNLRLVFNRKDKSIKNLYISFYENARTTQYYSKNEFFWIQYALAVMEVHDYDAAEIYLDNASAFSKEHFSEESYHIESLRARLLLEKTMYEDNYENSFKNFERAHSLICSNRTPERHYPYRQASNYIGYYSKFYKRFSNDEKVYFMQMCIEMKNKMNEYLNSKNVYERNNRKSSKEIEHIVRRIEGIVTEMAKDA